ncbi:MAG: hypothetical protein R3Y16_06135 [Rikenellaceae bacterium]
MFTNYPTSYQSLYSELIYSHETATEGDVTLFISDSTSDEVLGVKKFYTTTTADINIAPIVRAAAYPDPELSQSGFITEQSPCLVEVTVSDADQTATSSRTFTLSREEESEVGLMSSFDSSDRLIALGEGEWLTLRVDPEKAIEAEIRQYAYGSDRVSASRLYTLAAQSSGVVTFAVVAEWLSQQSGSLSDIELDYFEVIFSQDDETIAEVCYSVIDDYEEPTRLAWISSRGSLEHYTFPVVSERVISSERKQSFTLTSAYENYTTRKAIAEIVESPLVWLVSGAEYREVSLASDSVEVEPRRELTVIEVKISMDNE